MQESSLHTALKRYYAQPGDRLEFPLDGFLIDILNDTECIEIQIGNFPALKTKLASLLPNHVVRVVYPISQLRWIEKITPGNPDQMKRRRSPKKGSMYELLNQLVYLSPFLRHPNFKCEIVFISEIEVQYADGQGSWRRKGWSIIDHRLEQVFSTIPFQSAADYAVFIPAQLQGNFTTRDFAQSAGITRRLAGKTCYVLKQLDLIEVVGKQRRAQLFRKKRIE